MNKLIKKVATIGALAFIIFASLGTTINASAGSKSVLKSYKLDINKYTPEQKIFEQKYIEVPSSAVFSYSTTEKIGGGWNYNRFLVINFYESDLGWH